jgi:hypothetical protein
MIKYLNYIINMSHLQRILLKNQNNMYSIMFDIKEYSLNLLKLINYFEDLLKFILHFHFYSIKYHHQYVLLKRKNRLSSL